MEINLNIEATALAGGKLKDAYKISKYLFTEFQFKEYGNDVNKIIAVLNCYDPNFGTLSKEWETGTVIYKKYQRSKKILSFDVKINHKEVLRASHEAISDIIRQALIATYSEIKGLAIKDFKIDEFYRDLDQLLTVKRWKTHPEDYRREIYEFGKNVVSGSELTFNSMKESIFWNFIKDSVKISKGDINGQIESLINLLSIQTDEIIIGFEITLRSLIKKAYHVNVLALDKVVEGFVTDDSFLYFRAKLILLGKALFYQAITDPNKFGIIINQDYVGEELLTVADIAYQRKKGKEYHEELPRGMVFDIINYDDLSADPEGVMWAKSEFDSRYADLINLYKKLP